MSTFVVTYRNISKVWNHPNADRLDLAQVDGLSYQFVVGRDEYKIGDEVLYFPVDSVLCKSLISELGLEGRLSGKDKNRIKTVRLRGEISQGLVAKPITAFGKNVLGPDIYGIAKSFKELFIEQGAVEFTRVIGVTKYDPPPIMSHAGNLVHMPDEVGVYDIEGADQFPEIIEELMDQRVSITEKVEGTNFWISAAPCDKLFINGEKLQEFSLLPKISFGQRHHEIQPIEGVEHSFLRLAKELKLDRFVSILASDMFKGHRVTARGEYAGPGVQGNIYKLPTNQIYIFDIKVGERYLSPEEFVTITSLHGVRIPPIVAHDVVLKDFLNGRTIREVSTGPSVISVGKAILREGIVIKPMTEQRNQKIGRLFIKQRSPEYLAENDL